MDQINKKIIWIDDDINKMFLRPYLDEFQDKGYTVIAVNNPDMVDDVIKAHHDDFLAIILDILMPPGEKIDFQIARGGLLTGYVILNHLLEDENLKNKPIIIFSNVDENNIRTFVNSENVTYLLKNEYFADTFVNEIEYILKRK